MSALQGLLDKRFQLNQAVEVQLGELKRNGVFINGVHVPRKENAKCLQALLKELKKVNKDIRSALDARNQELETHCCFRVKSSNCCGNNQERRWTVNVLKLQMSALLVSAGAIGTGLIIKSTSENQSDIVVGAVGLTAVAVAAVASLIMHYDQNKIYAARNAAAAVIEQVDPPGQVGIKVWLFLTSLEAFKKRPNNKTLKECLQMWKLLSPRDRKELPGYKNLIKEMIYLLPEDDECKLLMHELYRLVAARSQGKVQVINPSANLVTISEEETKESVDDLAIDPDLDRLLLTKYKKKWEKLEELLGVQVQDLLCGNICHDQFGNWWVNQVSKNEEIKKRVAEVQLEVFADNREHSTNNLFQSIPPLEASFLPVTLAADASGRSNTPAITLNPPSPGSSVSPRAAQPLLEEQK